MGNAPNAYKCFLMNERSRDEETVPEIGWVYSHNGQFKSDDGSLVVTRGPMSRCRDITITGDIADKFPEYTGVFHVTDRIRYGKPVFVNDHGKFLYSGNKMEDSYGWHIEDRISKINEGSSVIRSNSTPICPGDTPSWQYWDGAKWIGCNASVICSIHQK